MAFIGLDFFLASGGWCIWCTSVSSRDLAAALAKLKGLIAMLLKAVMAEFAAALLTSPCSACLCLRVVV